MSLLHPALLLGLVFAAVPVVLHLMLRARPKKLVFPALRLLQKRQIQNRRRLRLRHLWLLLLRMALIAALVLLVTRPLLPPANYGPTAGEFFTLAGILVMAVLVYGACMAYWRKQSVPPADLRMRRTYLRGSMGLVTVLALLAFFAWPYQKRVAAEITSPVPASLTNLPVAAVFLCDTSLSMTYLFEGKSRLDEAKTMAVAQLRQLPTGSAAAVLDGTGDLPTVMTLDLAAAQNRLEALTPQSVVLSLDEQIRMAIRTQDDERNRTLGSQVSIEEGLRQDQYLREIYVVTDLARSAWRKDDSQTLRTLLEEREWLSVYLLDVGIEEPTNTGVIALRLSRPSVGSQGALNLEAVVRGTGGTASDVQVELWQGVDDGPIAKRDQKTVNVTDKEGSRVQFQLENLSGSLVQGSLKLASTDPLTLDNEAFFSVPVLPPLKVVVAAPDRGTAAFWMEALAGLSATGHAYDARYVSSETIDALNLAEVDIVCLINAPRPSESNWRTLGEFTRNGGGLLVVLGSPSAVATGSPGGLDPLAYSSADALAVLPVKPKASLRFSQPAHLNFRDTSHSLARHLDEIGALTELADVDFHRYWSVDVQPGSLTIGQWTDEASQPAFVVREVGRGRCAVFTSSVDSTAWSDWPRNWTYLAAADEWLRLLSRQATSLYTLTTGDPVVIPFVNSRSGQAVPSNALLRQPDLTQRRIDLNTTNHEFVINDARLAGHYQLFTTVAAPELISGFSLNHPGAESDLTRWSSAELDEMLGADRYGIARSLDQLNRSVKAGRLGQEVSGLLLALLSVVFVLEQATATWFYRQDETP